MDASEKQVDQRHHHLAVSQILSESVVDSTHMFGFSNHAALPNDISAVLFSVFNAHLIKALRNCPHTTFVSGQASHFDFGLNSWDGKLPAKYIANLVEAHTYCCASHVDC